jgi:3,4-dihydroxy 2-butanone 4-phosphate synthase
MVIVTDGGNTITTIKQAITDLQHGKFVLIFDDEKREGETDFVLPAQYCTSAAIHRMRHDGGGLIILMTSYSIAQKLKLPFLTDLYNGCNGTYPVLKALVPNDIPYDSKSSFSLYINHRKTFTGITDNDRSLTIQSFAHLIDQINGKSDDQAVHLFGKEFRSPGHVPICLAQQGLLTHRSGHTELSIALMHMAGLLPAAAGCEIMGDNGKARSKREVQHYAEHHGFTFLNGKEIIEAWKQWSR